MQSKLKLLVIIIVNVNYFQNENAFIKKYKHSICIFLKM